MAFHRKYVEYTAALEHLRSPMPVAAINEIFARCITDSQVFFPKVLLSLLHTRQVSWRSHPSMAAALAGALEGKDMGLVREACVLMVADLPEAEVVRCMAALLGPKLTVMISDKAVEGTMRNESPAATFIRVCMSRSWSEGPLVAALTNLSPDHALMLLSQGVLWLRRVVHVPAATLVERFTSHHPASGVVPSLAQVTDWISFVLDAHFSAFLLNKECHAILEVLSRELRVQKEACERAGDLVGILAYMCSKPTLIRQQVGAYTLEDITY